MDSIETSNNEPERITIIQTYKPKESAIIQTDGTEANNGAPKESTYSSLLGAHLSTSESPHRGCITITGHLVANFFVHTAKDMLIHFSTPIAMVWLQMPYIMLPCSYIFGQLGCRVDTTLTSEYATRNDLVLVRALLLMINS
jgi:hypothetical protein